MSKMPATKEETFSFNNYDAIGFDLDNTLARFKVGPMMEMEYNIIADIMIKEWNYDPEFLRQPINTDFWLRGLFLDTRRGNVVKINKDGVVIRTTHGSRHLSSEEILKYYPNGHWELTDKYVKDPLELWECDDLRALGDYFDMPASLIFARGVDYLDSKDPSPDKDYLKVYAHLKSAFQVIFNVNTFSLGTSPYFEELKANPSKYYYQCSPNVTEWLKQLKKAGKVLFLITGSFIDFAAFTASQALGKDWQDYFNIVICHAKKPGFFTKDRPAMKVTNSGDGQWTLKPLCDGTPLCENERFEEGRIYANGNWKQMEEFLKEKGSSKILFLGDNVVQDVYGPKKYTSMDTVCICEELESELKGEHKMDFHPHAEHLRSDHWGSYFGGDAHDEIHDTSTLWYHFIKEYANFAVPSIEYCAKFDIKHVFSSNLNIL